MADTVTSSDELKIELLFEDTDTRTITLKNPKSRIDASEIADLQTLLMNDGNSLLISDKTGAQINKIKLVKKVTTTRTNIEIIA